MDKSKYDVCLFALSSDHINIADIHVEMKEKIFLKVMA